MQLDLRYRREKQRNKIIVKPLYRKSGVTDRERQACKKHRNGEFDINQVTLEYRPMCSAGAKTRITANTSHSQHRWCHPLYTVIYTYSSSITRTSSRGQPNQLKQVKYLYEEFFLSLIKEGFWFCASAFKIRKIQVK